MRTFSPVLALAAGLLQWSAPVSAAESRDVPTTLLPVTEEAIPSSLESPQFELSIHPELAQANPLWSDVVFHKHRTLGKKGCAIVASYAIAQKAGYTGSLVEFTEGLKALKGFNEDGNLIWDRVNALAPVLTNRRDIKDSVLILAQARIEVISGRYAALQLRTPETREHWIAAIAIQGDDLIVIDPAGGKMARFQDLYEVGHLRGITIFRKVAPVQMAAAN